MSTLYPIKVGDFKFYVNPTKIGVHKQSQISEMRTMGGTTFQIWPDLPDVVNFEGMTWGTRALAELRGLQQQIARSPEAKQTTIVYKNKRYDGYLKELTVDADAEKPRQYNYKFTFICRKRFSLDTLPIGNLDGAKAEFDFMAAQLRTASAAILGLPNEVLSNAKAVYGEISGKSGASQSGLGIFIGRPTSGISNGKIL